MFWRKKQGFDDAKKDEFVEAISLMLETQMVVVPGRYIEDAQGQINRKAIGYIYGYVDAALTSIGQDMSDMSLSVPIMYQILRHLFPGHEEIYTRFPMDNIGQDDELTLGVMKGGQQYVDFTKPGAEGAPMGLAGIMLEALEAEDSE